ncbi:MAG: DUF2182 domain-containing protein [Rhodanobacteraceae bacterium]|nr:MAG: DUF2182 domain-containing protein [Rhodanobacteraceae bacterium]
MPDAATAGSALEAVLRRDRTLVQASLAALTALAWGYLLWLALGMGMSVDGMVGVARSWTTSEFVLMFVMWTVMMVGMMTPSAAPMVLIYARVGRQATLQGKPLAATGFFAGGYLLAWSAFALAATAAQWGLHRALLLTPMMASANTMLSGAVLIVAGVYQWTPVKQACLRHCQAPLSFILQLGGFRRALRRSLALGLRHGLYCIGCCWALMLLLFVGGVMNLLWIAVLSIVVLAEKVMPAGNWLPRVTGVVLFGAGIVVLSGAFS